MTKPDNTESSPKAVVFTQHMGETVRSRKSDDTRKAKRILLVLNALNHLIWAMLGVVPRPVDSTDRPLLKTNGQLRLMQLSVMLNTIDPMVKVGSTEKFIRECKKEKQQFRVTPAKRLILATIEVVRLLEDGYLPAKKLRDPEALSRLLIEIDPELEMIREFILGDLWSTRGNFR